MAPVGVDVASPDFDGDEAAAVDGLGEEVGGAGPGVLVECWPGGD